MIGCGNICFRRNGKIELHITGTATLLAIREHPGYEATEQQVIDFALANQAELSKEQGEDHVEVSVDIGQTRRGALDGIVSLLLSLARTQTQIGSQDAASEKVFEILRKQRSDALAVQLKTK